MRILIIEDDPEMSASLKRVLTEAGYAVDAVFTGENGRQMADDFPYDLIVLDVILPGIDGLEVCRSLRRNKTAARILMLAQKTALADRVAGLDCGADDYLAKPFEVDELLARARALLRRAAGGTPLLQASSITLDTVNRRVICEGREIMLRPREYAILHYLMSQGGNTVTRSMIEGHVWNIDTRETTHLLDVYMSNLRKKLGEGVIETVRGVGYRIK
jgi:two-component system, OmpR family, response regulator